jgi:hypothetical protein
LIVSTGAQINLKRVQESYPGLRLLLAKLWSRDFGHYFGFYSEKKASWDSLLAALILLSTPTGLMVSIDRQSATRRIGPYIASGLNAALHHLLFLGISGLGAIRGVHHRRDNSISHRFYLGNLDRKFADI